MKNNICVVSHHGLPKSAGIQTVTRTLFENHFPIFYLDKEPNLSLDNFDLIIMSGFDKEFIPLTEKLHAAGKKIAVFWHYSAAHEVDSEISECWLALLNMVQNGLVDMFINCKKDLHQMVESLFCIPAFFIMNNAMETQYCDIEKNGIGIYSGSSDYWAKNLRPCLYGAALSGKPIDVLPYDESLQKIVEQIGISNRVTGISEPLKHDDFLKRMSSCEAVCYVTFTEAAPILPLEALNNDVICLVGNNHPYFKEDPVLKDYLTVLEPDNPVEINRKMQIALKHREEILMRYRNWKASYDIRQAENFQIFLRKLDELCIL